jgi:8-oxo-dGTP pyrophosphatase MutT (NUDIX family)
MIHKNSDDIQWRKAAVLIPFYRENDQEYVILTRRTEEMEHHKGQIAFPGGAYDDADEDLWATALRETEEEIGLSRNDIRLVKELNQQLTPTGFRVTPFVGEITVPKEWHLNPIEIAEIFSVPLDHLRNPSNLEIKMTTYQGIEIPDPHFSYEHHTIWGMTGRVLYEFLGLEWKEQ